ncbi:MAG: hypothetical protein J6C89_00160 [Clostridia bacterium]|nr:hypothetical protein [Clostridia bacterium]
MKKIKRIFTCLSVFNKRFLKKPGFIALLLVVPCLVLALNIASKGESGMVTVALAAKDKTDALASQIMTDIADGSSLIRFVECETPEEAVKLVERADADAAWIFPAELAGKIDDFVENRNKRFSFAEVVVREDTVMLGLARERLYSVLYPYCSRALYQNYIERNVTELSALTEEELISYYDEINAEGDDLFVFSYSDAGQDASDAANMNYITAPVRGLLALFTVMAGFAVALFYMQDEREGRFVNFARKRRFPIMAGYYFCAIFDVAVVVFLSLVFSGVFYSFWKELLLILLYIPLCVGFCMLVSQICASRRLLGSLLPLLAVAMIVVCPVFFDIGLPRVITLIFPPTYYLTALHNTKYIFYMAAYTLFLFICNFFVYRTKLRTNMA